MSSARKSGNIDDSFEQFAANLREVAAVESQDHIISEGYLSEEEWSCRLKDYVFEFILGTGAFGDVIKARNLTENKDCAIKLLSYRFSDKRHILDEIKAMSRLSHPNLVGKYAVSVINRSTIFIVMPLLWNLRLLSQESLVFRRNMARAYAMMSLTQIKPVGPVSENCAGQIVHQLLTGLDFMHKNRYIHRDLKSGNLLVSNNGTVKIGDFGLTKQFETGKFKLGEIKTPVGTRCYMAPEITLRFAKVTENPYDIRAETWSIGAIICELLMNCLPFAHYPAHAEGMVKTLKTATKEKYIIWSLMFPPRIYEGIAMDLSLGCRDFIDKCLVGNAAQRKTCSELLKNSWIKKFKGKKGLIEEELLKDQVKKGVFEKMKTANKQFWAHNGGSRRPLNVNMLLNPMGKQMYFLKFTVNASMIGGLDRSIQQDCRACLLMLTNNRLISTTNYFILCERIPELVVARAERDFENSNLIFPFSRKDDVIPDKENLSGQALIVITANNSEWDSVLSHNYPHLVKQYETAMSCRRIPMRIKQDDREPTTENVIKYIESEDESDGDSGVATTHKNSASDLSSESSVEPDAKRKNIFERGRSALKSFFNKDKEETGKRNTDDD